MTSSDMPDVLSRPLEPSELKADLRARRREARQQRSERLRAEKAIAISEHLLKLASVKNATCVSVYASRPFEPGTGPFLEALTSRGVRVLVPVLGDGLQRGWAEFQSLADLVERAPGRPPEPSGSFLGSASLSDANVIVVPALAVDTSGTRLGQGGGWYDRALEQASPDAHIVAVSFTDEVHDATVDPLPVEPHDIPVHGVVTPEGYTELPVEVTP